MGLTTFISFLYIGGWVAGFCLAVKNSDHDFPYQILGHYHFITGSETKKLDMSTDKNPQATLLKACLLTAAKRGSLVVVKALLSQPLCELLARDEEGNTALHLAASGGYHELVLELASKYDLPSGGRNDVAQTPLHMAASKGRVESVRVLATLFPDDLKVKDKYDNLPLHTAALFGHSDTVDCLCQEFDGDIESVGNYNTTCLHLSCCGGHIKLTQKLLLKYNCRRDALDEAGGLASSCAATYGHTHLLEMLIDEFNFSPTTKRLSDGMNLLHLACVERHLKTIHILIKKYCLDPNARTSAEHTALHYVCLPAGDTLENVANFHFPDDIEPTALVDILVDLKCDPMDKDKSGCTALHYAAYSGETKMVSQLVTKYKCVVEDTDTDGDTPLHHAAIEGNPGVVSILLSELNANMQARNQQNHTALHIAAFNGHTEVVTLLVEQFGCSPNTKGFKNRTPLHYACNGGHLELAEKLIDDYHCDPMARDDDGATPLHISTLTGKEIIMSKLILKYKCLQDISDNDGQTPLHYAASSGNAGIIRILLSELGANILARNKQNKTALHIVALNGHTEVVTLLVEQFGCSPNTKGFKNRIPLHYACGGGHFELAEKLIDDYHCDPMARDDDGATPLHISALAGKEIVMSKLILKYKCSQYVSDNDGDTLLHYSVGTEDSAMKCLEFLVDVIGTFPSIKNNMGKLPIDRESLELFLRPNMRTCVTYLSKHAVGEYRHAPPKLLVFDKKIVSTLSDYSIYSLLSPTFAQSCGLCYMDSLVNDLWVCQVGAEAQHTSLLQSLLSGPILMAIITINVNLTTNEAVSEALTQVSLAKQLAYHDGSTNVPLRIMLAGNSALDKEDVFNEICKKIVDKQPIHFSQHFLSCTNDNFSENIFPIISDFINTSVSTVPNPDVREITHGSIQLLKFLYQDNPGRFYVKFSQVAKQLENRRIMSEDHPEEILACLRQLDTQGYLVATGTSDLPKYIILNPLHMVQVMEQFSQNTSDTFARLGLYSKRLLGSIFPDSEFSLIESFLSKLRLFLVVPDPLVNLVMKQDLYTHVDEKHFFIPQLATSGRQLNCWTCQPESVFSCGLHVITPGNLDSFPPQLTTDVFIQAVQFFITNFLIEPYRLVDCTLWKGGIVWMVDNVEILVEVVQEESSVVLMGRSDVCNQLKCMDMFVKIVDMVLEVKSVCCGGIVHMVDALDPNALESKTIPCGDEMLWCDTSSTARALTRSRKNIQSKCKTKQFSVEKLEWLFRFSLRGMCKESPTSSYTNQCIYTGCLNTSMHE